METMEGMTDDATVETSRTPEPVWTSEELAAFKRELGVCSCVPAGASFAPEEPFSEAL